MTAIGLLPSTVPALPVMLAAVSASTLAASVLDSARTGRPPSPVRIDVGHVALASRSERYARTDGSPPSDLFDALSRFWRTADGWLRLHANYPWHRDRALKVLDCRGQPETVEAAVRGWPGEDLETALADADGVGFAVRTGHEWAEHPQGVAVARLPLLDAVPVPSGHGAPRSLGSGRAAAWARSST